MSQPASPLQPEIVLPGAKWSDRQWLTILFFLTLGLRLWQLSHTELTTRDSIGYIHQAWRFEQEPWTEVIRTSAQHPGYAFCIHLLSSAVRPSYPDDLPRAMELSAQLVSAIASILLIFPVFYLGKELFDSRVGFWTSILLQVLPSTGRMMPDGLSEPLFLLCAGSALYSAVKAVHTRKLAWYTVAGFATGISYLVRTEGLVVVLITIAVLLCLQRSLRWKQTWREVFAQGAALATSCAVVAFPFMILIGGLTLKVSANYMLEREGWVQPPRKQQAAVTTPLPPAIWWIGPDVSPRDRVTWAAWALLIVLDKSFFHIMSLPALWGMWLFRRWPAARPGMWIPFGIAILLLPLLYRLAQSAGYVGERHVLFILLGGLYAAVATIGVWGGWLAKRVPGITPSLIAGSALVLLVGVCVPKSLATLHGNRTGFRQVGVWLAKNTDPEDLILDPLAWSNYHAGRIFRRGGPQFPGDCYVVLERSDNDHPHLFYLIDHAKDMARWGRVVHQEEVRRGKKRVTVVVYKVPVDGQGHPIPRPNPLKL